jgi:hypothetical protein
MSFSLIQGDYPPVSNPKFEYLDFYAFTTGRSGVSLFWHRAPFLSSRDPRACRNPMGERKVLNPCAGESYVRPGTNFSYDQQSPLSSREPEC